VIAVEIGRVCICRFASAIFAFICAKLNPLKLRLLACDGAAGVPVTGNVLAGCCTTIGGGVIIGFGGIVFVTTTREFAGVGWLCGV
jgi:hypothetical protein